MIGLILFEEIKSVILSSRFQPFLMISALDLFLEPNPPPPNKKQHHHREQLIMDIFCFLDYNPQESKRKLLFHYLIFLKKVCFFTFPVI